MTTPSAWRVRGGWLHATGELDLTPFEHIMSEWGLSWMRRTVPYLLRAILQLSPDAASPDGTLRGLVVSKEMPVGVKNELIAPFVLWQLKNESLIDECFEAESESGQFKPAHVAEAYARARNAGHPAGFYLDAVYGGVRAKRALNETLRTMPPMVVVRQDRAFRVETPSLDELRARRAEAHAAAQAIPDLQRRKRLAEIEARWSGR